MRLAGEPGQEEEWEEVSPGERSLSSRSDDRDRRDSEPERGGGLSWSCTPGKGWAPMLDICTRASQDGVEAERADYHQAAWIEPWLLSS